jgi:hypothetical protein
VFQKSYIEIFSELDETKAEPHIFIEALQKPKMRWRGARGQAHHRVAWPSDAGRITTQLETPRGWYDEHSSKSFPQ